jgi:hypothetical protein
VIPLAIALASLLLFPFDLVRNSEMRLCLSEKGPALMLEMTASEKSFRLALLVQESSMAWSSGPLLPASIPAIRRSLRAGREGLVLPRMKAWSRGSMVVLIRVAASASVRAMARRSEPGNVSYGGLDCAR